MRPRHLIRRTKADSYPQNVICLACAVRWTNTSRPIYTQSAELVRWIGVGFSGVSGVYGKDHWAEGTTAEEFWDAIGHQLRRRGPTTIFIGSAKFALTLLRLWDFVSTGNISLCGIDQRDTARKRGNGAYRPGMRVVLESPPTIIEGKVGGSASRFKVLDIENFGLQTCQDEVPVETRVRRTAEFVRGMVEALKSNGLGSLKDTVGGQSLFSFKRKSLTHLMECHNDERALALEGDSYFGGRCEAFHIGRLSQRVYHLDCASMYPYCAATSSVPVCLSGVAYNLGCGDQPQLGGSGGIIADVTLDTDEPCYPYRDMDSGITVYPIGVFRTTLAGPELLDALSRDRVVRWHRASWYELAPALQAYMRLILDMKVTHSSNVDLSTWIKMLGNCLIGKFGTKDKRWVDAVSDNIHGEWDQWYEPIGDHEWARFRSVSNYVQREELSGWSYDAIPAVASWVTSLARVRLLKMIRCASWRECYYVDTDALMVGETGYRNLVNDGWVRDNEPGFLRVKNVSERAEIHGIKSYDEEGRSVRAGRPLYVASAGAGEVRYWIHRQAFGSSRERRAPEAVRIAVPFTTQIDYQHGLVCADGTVTPHQLNEG